MSTDDSRYGKPVTAEELHRHLGPNSGKYWICVDSNLRVHRKQKLNRAPSLAQTIDGVWIALGKKTWQKCRVGVAVSEKIVTEESMRLVRAMRAREGNLPS